MKEKIQKYLSGEREGFSLVELIIVIAIMAILIGVVALAVIPYLAKSKESKDLTTLDTVCSALSTAVADTKVSGTKTFEYGASAPADATAAKVYNAMKGVLGNGSTTLQSDNAAGAKIYCKFDTSNNTIQVYASADGTTAVALKYNETGYDTNLSTKSDGMALVVSN